jgi:c-di-GMP-binding flagellar brake protein YcgR
MTPSEIQPGTRLELEMLNRNGERIGSTYVSQLLETQEDGCLVISLPIFEARLIFVPLQAQISLNFMHPKYGLLGFSAMVTGREHRDNIAILIIQPQGEVIRIQRRNHFRMNHMASALIWVSEKDDKADRKSAVKAVTKNISGSGLCIVTEIDLPKNTEINIEFNLSENITISAKCVVIRNHTFEIKNHKSYELGLHFTKLFAKDQDSIIRFIFEQQRVKLRNEPK